jgi:large subunit ribosomal protein L30
MVGEPRQRKCLVVVRIRGVVSASREARETLDMLHLTRNNYAILAEDSPSFLGMLKAAQSFITWGEATKETVDSLIRKKGRLNGNKKLDDEYAKKAGYDSLNKLLEAASGCSIKYRELPNVQPVFKLHPPTKGYKGKTKKSYRVGGELGYRGQEINELIARMV